MGDFKEFIQSVKNLTGIDISLYKENQMKRRLDSFIAKKGHSSYKTFFEMMRRDNEALQEFLDRMTINVSEFFRNKSRWDALQNKILPQLIKEKSKLKCWSAACSTGQEPYTLAMICSQIPEVSALDILATDLDEIVLQKAMKGIYSKNELGTLLPLDIINKYFVVSGDTYAVRNELKKSIRFKKHNLLADNFDHEYDLIICRNVMIYFTEEAKSMLYKKFSNSLRKNGILFVGSTEQIFQPSQYSLDVEDTFFYRKV